MKNLKERFRISLIDENPTFVSFLALCPTLGTTNSLSNAIGMGVSVLIVLVLSNSIIAAIKSYIPHNIRIPVYITIIATLVTIIQMLMETFIPSLYSTLGIFLPLIVVNCIILGRAEAYASKNNVKNSAIDGLTTGFAFLISLCVIGVARELIGTGSIELLNLTLWEPEQAISIFSQGSGAFLMFGLLAWAFNEFKVKYDRKKKAQAKEIE